MEGETKQRKDRLLPASILISGILISVSLIYSAGKQSLQKEKLTGSLAGSPPLEEVEKVSKEDHIQGNANAQIVIIEFSDLECPFCKAFHKTMKQVLSEYGEEVAWVYRHFPLDDLHPKARKESEASECAAELGGNDRFWAYVDRLFEITPSNNGLDPALLPQIAEDTGLDRKKFESCLDSGRYATKIQKHIDEAIRSGGRGTPFSVLVTKKGERYAIPGALPYEGENRQSMKAIIEAALEN